MSKIRGKLTYANVVSSVCLFLLLGGGAAFAAIQLPKNSVGPKQLKKNAVTPAKLSVSVKKSFASKQGPQGPQGLKGEKGEPGPLLEALPSGKTEKGAYGFASTRASGGGKFAPGTEVSYPVPLAFTPTVRIVKNGGAPTAECPGSVKSPAASPGFLCLYNQREDVEVSVENLPEPGHYGFLLFFGAAEGANYENTGTWAVTAP